MAGPAAMSGTTSPAAPQTTTSSTNANSRQETPPVPAWARQFKQLGFFFAGAGVMAASVAISRRAVVRRRVESIPKFFVSNRAPIKFDSADRGSLAVEALTLATLNVMSFGVLLVGGIGWGFDLSSVDELQARTRAVTRRPGVVSPEDEAQMEEMMQSLMARMGMEKPASTEVLQKEDELKKN